MTEIQKMMKMLEKVYFYWYYCVMIMSVNDDDDAVEMVINQMNLVEHVKTEVVVVENN